MPSALSLFLEVGCLFAVEGASFKATFKGVKHVDDLPSFDSFVSIHGRALESSTAEYALRSRLFHERLHKVKHHNEKPERLWTATINKFSDRTEEELQRLRGWRGAVSSRHQRDSAPHLHKRTGMFLGQSDSSVISDEKDWSHLNATQVEIDQGSCGSCWAVAAVNVLQAGAEIHSSSRTFSAQELVSCVPNPQHCGGEGGCKGATVELAMQYVMEHGLKTQEAWPYDATDGKCNDRSFSQDEWRGPAFTEILATGVHSVSPSTSPARAFGLVSWEKLPSNKYKPLMVAVATHGPVAVSVAASAWFGYSHGIFNGCDKDAVVDHAVVVIGYGKDGQEHHKYWNIKNSWGTSWGESGNIRLLRSDDDDTAQCGVDKQPEVGTGCEGGPTEVPVCGMCGILYDSVVPHFTSD